tara:strand:+ start:195 stop:800 length:606 start_codon:yes stop_codon:yes gene_type:complete
MENKSAAVSSLDYIRLHSSNPKSIHFACNVLKNGGIIVYPTDTIYGFGCDARNDKAILNLNKIKRRSGPMSVLIDSIKNGKNWMEISARSKQEAEYRLKKGGTIIVPVRENIVSNLITGRPLTLGMRVAKNTFCKNLLKAYGKPITSTSVNRSGSIPHVDPDEIENEFKSEINMLIENNRIIGTASKIFKLKNNKWTVIRK